jgi:hypothetical protein
MSWDVPPHAGGGIEFPHFGKPHFPLAFRTKTLWDWGHGLWHGGGGVHKFFFIKFLTEIYIYISLSCPALFPLTASAVLWNVRLHPLGVDFCWQLPPSTTFLGTAWFSPHMVPCLLRLLRIKSKTGFTPSWGVTILIKC